MTGMELYVRFMLTLAVGLAGLALVQAIVLDTLFAEWDLPRDLRRWARGVGHGRHVSALRAEDILLELERARRDGRYQRPAPAASIDRRREALRELREAESRLASPAN